MNIIEASNEIYRKGFVVGTDGNLSYLSGNGIVFTKENTCKGRIEFLHQSCVFYHFDNPNRIPDSITSEYKTHIALYTSNPEVKAIIHAHPVNVNTLSFYGFDYVFYNSCAFCPEAYLKLGDISLIQYFTPSSSELSKAIENRKKGERDKAVVVLSRHGVLIGGKDFEECLYKLEKLEYMAKILVKGINIPKFATPLTKEEKTKLLKQYQ